MRIKTTSMSAAGAITGYTLWLSRSDTYRWARKPGAAWPCSKCSGRRLVVGVNSNGLCDLAVDGRTVDVDGNELEAIVADHLPAEYRHLWPTWEA